MTNSQPVTLECPIACLGLSYATVKLLTPHLETARPTVGDVLSLWGTGLLLDLDGIGEIRVVEIVAALSSAGVLHDHGRTDDGGRTQDAGPIDGDG
jgi:hypothetical protein